MADSFCLRTIHEETQSTERGLRRSTYNLLLESRSFNERVVNLQKTLRKNNKLLLLVSKYDKSQVIAYKSPEYIFFLW